MWSDGRQLERRRLARHAGHGQRPQRRVAAIRRLILSAATTVWEANISGAAGRDNDGSHEAGVKITTFPGINIEQFGVVQLEGGSLDAQYVEILGGTLGRQRQHHHRQRADRRAG